MGIRGHAMAGGARRYGGVTEHFCPMEYLLWRCMPPPRKQAWSGIPPSVLLLSKLHPSIRFKRSGYMPSSQDTNFTL